MQIHLFLKFPCPHRREYPIITASNYDTIHFKPFFSRASPGTEKHGTLYHFALLHGIIMRFDENRGRENKKRPCLARDKGANLCGTTLFAALGRTATQGKPGNGGGRRDLVVRQGRSVFCSEVMFLPLPPAVFHRTTALCTGRGGELLSSSTHIPSICPHILSTFPGNVKA